MSATFPPHSIAAPGFRFRALAALAGRSPLGGDREIILATLIAARLASSRLPPDCLPPETRQARADRAARWLGSMAIPTAVRGPVGCLITASAVAGDAELADAIAALIDAAGNLLDRGARAELEKLARGVLQRGPDA